MWKIFNEGSIIEYLAKIVQLGNVYAQILKQSIIQEPQDYLPEDLRLRNFHLQGIPKVQDEGSKVQHLGKINLSQINLIYFVLVKFDWVLFLFVVIFAVLDDNLLKNRCFLDLAHSCLGDQIMETGLDLELLEKV